MLTWSQHSIFFISLVFHFAIVKSANYFWRLFCIDTTRFNGRYPFIYYCWTENVRLYNLFLRKRNKRKQVKSQTKYASLNFQRGRNELPGIKPLFLLTFLKNVGLIVWFSNCFGFHLYYQINCYGNVASIVWTF